MTVPPILWTPSPERVERAALTEYTSWIEEKHGLSLPDYAALWEWSTTDLEAFWASIWERFDVRASAPYERVLGSREMPGAVWFPGARLNFAEHVLRPRADGEVAIRHASELRPLGETTQGELRQEVARIAAGLRSLGIGPGDRVVAYLPNIPEAIAAQLACASIGAIWSSCSPDFGARSVIDRFAQIEPKSGEHDDQIAPIEARASCAAMASGMFGRYATTRWPGRCSCVPHREPPHLLPQLALCLSPQRPQLRGMPDRDLAVGARPQHGLGEVEARAREPGAPGTPGPGRALVRSRHPHLEPLPDRRPERLQVRRQPLPRAA